MKKIIEQGNKKINIIGCNFCGTIFKCSNDKIKEKCQLGGKRKFIRRYVKCPYCKNKLVLETIYDFYHTFLIGKKI